MALQIDKESKAQNVGSNELLSPVHRRPKDDLSPSPSSVANATAPSMQMSPINTTRAMIISSQTASSENKMQAVRAYLTDLYSDDVTSDLVTYMECGDVFDFTIDDDEPFDFEDILSQLKKPFEGNTLIENLSSNEMNEENLEHITKIASSELYRGLREAFKEGGWRQRPLPPSAGHSRGARSSLRHFAVIGVVERRRSGPRFPSSVISEQRTGDELHSRHPLALQIPHSAR